MGKLIDNEPDSGYVFPISLCIERIRQDAEAEFEKNVLHAVLECGVVVDKDELIKALQYDRDQFQKGFAAGVEWAGPKWISVEDDLPAYVIDSFLVCYDDGLVGIADWSHDLWENNWWFHTDGEYDIDGITHWMPLPKAPKEE